VRRRSLDEQVKREIKDPKAYLASMGLPPEYPSMINRTQYEVRMSVLHGWYDPKKPHVLVPPGYLEKFIQAFRLWVEFYIKPAECNSGIYYFDDFAGKYDFVREAFSPALEEGQPSKSIFTATRRAGKTQTLIVEVMPFIGITRPFSPMLISELNDTRTSEEISKIKNQVEENERIHHDFGGEGKLFPKSSGTRKWNAHHLQFIHHPGSEILGHSLDSAQRGRGPLFGVIDDPENDELTYNRDWRRKLINKILKVYVNMFHWGGHIVWIGTPIHRLSALSQAMRGEVDSDDGELSVVDPRFEDWRKIKMALIYKNDEDEWVSRQPERLSIPAFLKRMEINPLETRAEILCEPVTPGDRAFKLHQRDHWYMHCKNDRGEEYMYDMYTQEKLSWDNFVSSLRVFGAGDLADGQSADSDLGATVFIGVDPRGTIYVLDCFAKRCRYETLVDMACILGDQWNAERVVWERTSVQVIINRITRRIAEEHRKNGLNPPPMREISNESRRKISRILTLIPIFNRKEIRLLRMEPFKDSEGVVHTPVENPREGAMRELHSEIEEYTDEGINGPDDPLDALEMAVRTAGAAKGEAEEEPSDPNEEVIKAWKRVGLKMSPSTIPREAWTEQMIEDTQREENVLRKRERAGVIPWQ
jgi:hypothetical protein